MDISVSDKVGELKVYYVFGDGSLLLNNGKEVEKELHSLIESKEFTGEKFEESYINNIDKKEKILFLGLGEKSRYNSEALRRVTSEMIRFTNAKNIKSISIEFNQEDEVETSRTLKVLSESIILTNYSYDKYLSNKMVRSIKNVYISSMGNEKINEALKEGKTIGESTNIARDLVNQPSNIQTPEQLGKEVEILGEKYGFEVERFSEKEITEMGMEALYQVSKGSLNRPKLIVMRYMGNKKNDEKIGLVGKGITFDSGGINVKRGPRFIHMKHDMAGSAAVIGAICAIAHQKLQKNVVGIIAASENMISSKAYKPGDIINSMAGKSILINSTDAEGRLTLIDAIHYGIEKEKVDKVINIATLTGSARRILGSHGGIVMSNNEKLYENLEIASEKSDQMTLRLPIVEDLKSELKSDIADYINSSNLNTCGAITAGMFIREFVQDKPWIHMDMSGPCWSDTNNFYIKPGGTGWGSSLLYNLVKEMS